MRDELKEPREWLRRVDEEDEQKKENRYPLIGGPLGASICTLIQVMSASASGVSRYVTVERRRIRFQ
jgi:hypothetical protein